MRKLWFSLFLGLYVTLSYAQGPSSEGPSALNNAFYRAELYRLTGRTQQAVALYKKELEDDEKSEVALYQLSRIYAEQGMWVDALLLAEKAAALYPENLWVLRLLGKCQVESGLYPEALNTQIKLVQLRPNDLQYLEQAARLSWSIGEVETALGYLDDLELRLGTSPELVQWRKDIYLSDKKLKKAEKVLVNAVKAHPQTSAYVGLLAQFYANNGDLNKGVRTLEKALAEGLQDYNLHLELAQQLQAQGDFTRSMEHVLSALKMPKTPLESLKRTLVTLSEQALTNESLAAFSSEAQRILLEVHGTNSLAWLLHAFDAELNEDWAAALDAYKHAIDLGGAADEVLPAMVEIHLKQNENEAAATLLDELVTTYPNDPKMLLYAAYTYYSLEQHKACIDVVERYVPLTMVPESLAEVTELAAQAAFDMNDIERGAYWFDQCLQIDSNDRILNNYAWQLAVAEVHLDKALLLTRRSNEKSPYNATYLDTWAWVLYKAGNLKLAQEKIQLALRLLHEDPDPVVLLHAAKIEDALGNEERAATFREQRNALNSK